MKPIVASGKIVRRGARLAGWILLLVAGEAAAFSGGISGKSGNPSRNSGTNCTSCHGGGSFTNTTTIAGATTAVPGASGLNYSVSATSNGTRFGFNLSATGGSLNAGTGSRLTVVGDSSGLPGESGFAGELTHSAEQVSPSWSFTFDAPSSVGTVTMYACINAVNNDLGTGGDGAIDCDTHTITVNTAPNAVNDSDTVDEDSGATCISVLSNDTSGSSGNETGDSLSLFSVGTPNAGGSAFVGGGACSSNQVRYIPAANYFGPESFSYTVRDSLNSASFDDTAAVSISVTSINDQPTLNDPANQTVDEDSGPHVVNLSGIGTGAANETQTLVVTATSDNTGLIPNPTVTYTSPNATGSLTYTPAANQGGSATITVTVSDGGSPNPTRTQTFTINVTSGPDAPNAQDDVLPQLPLILREDEGPFVLDVLANDTDADGDALSVISVTQGSAGGSVAVSGAGPGNAVSYSPTLNFDGTKTFTYTVQDDSLEALSSVGSVSVTVSPVNDAPSITSSADTATNDGVPYQYQVTQSDVDDTVFTYSLSGAPTTGTPMTISATGLISWTPPISPTLADYTTAPITVTVTDSGGGEGIAAKLLATQTFSIAVSAPDTDGDGMPDSFENSFGLDPSSAADATLDGDGDGRNNLAEYQAGGNPNVDDVAPLLSFPPSIQVDATGFLTPVELGPVQAVDFRDGPRPVSVAPTPPEGFRPGRYQFTYSTTDSAGNPFSGTQQVDVRPRVELGADRVSGEGQTISVPVILNGTAPVYPVQITYTVGGSASGADHDAVNGTLTIASGTQGSIDIAIAGGDATESDETLVLTLASANGAVLGTRLSQTTTIVDRNVAPQVSVTVSQLGQARTQLFADQGAVTVTALADDANPGDTLSFDFSGSTVGPLPAAGATASFSFDPTGLSGRRLLRVRVSDAAGAAVTVEASVFIQASAPSLSAVADTDGDGLADAAEGFADADGDAVPDYLDAYTEAYVLPDQTGQPGASRLIEAEAGLGLRVGPTAIASGRAGALLSEADVIALGEGAGPVSNGDDSLDNNGGLFDFEIYGLAPGGSASVVLPLQSALRPGAVWRKYRVDAGWRDFVVDARNAVASAPSVDGLCPAPGSDGYTPGLTALHSCVRLSLQDGGPNDADGVVNGRVRDPGGAAVEPAVAASDPPTGKSGGGGALGLYLVAGLWGLAAIALYRRRRRTE